MDARVIRQHGRIAPRGGAAFSRILRSKAQGAELIAAEIRIPMTERDLLLGPVGHRPGSRAVGIEPAEDREAMPPRLIVAVPCLRRQGAVSPTDLEPSAGHKNGVLTR